MAQPHGASRRKSISGVDLGPQRRRRLGASEGRRWQKASASCTETLGRSRGLATGAKLFRRFARRLQRERERLFRDVGNKRFDHPAKPRGYVSRQ